jgi:hypothetical protein
MKLVDTLIVAGHLSAADGFTAKTTVQGNMDWMATHLPDIKDYLDDYIRRSNSSNLIGSGLLLAVLVVITISKHFLVSQ